jgi:hypothetical protein
MIIPGGFSGAPVAHITTVASSTRVTLRKTIFNEDRLFESQRRKVTATRQSHPPSV